MKIGPFNLDETVLVVAEIGNNHEGDPNVAAEMIRRAAECGVQAVKFQTFRTEHYVSAADDVRFGRLKRFELAEAQFAALAELSRSLGLLFISTPFDLGSAAFLAEHVDAYKIASGDNNFYPLIARVLEAGKPVVISTGISDLEQVRRTFEFVRNQIGQEGTWERLCLLHCVSAYPTPIEEANLRAIPRLAEEFGCTVGYSDHTLGTDASFLSVALGARLVEKHFTLAHDYSDFRDHQISANPEQMKGLVERVKTAQAALGMQEKRVESSEMAAKEAIRRSIVAGADLPAGHRVRLEDLTWIRPGGGLAPGEEERLLGRPLRRSVRFGEQLAEADVE